MNYDTKVTNQIEALSKKLGDLVSGSEITRFFEMVGLTDRLGEGMTKWKRIHNAFALSYNSNHSFEQIFQFIETVMDPVRFQDAVTFKNACNELNSTLLFMGREIGNDGKIKITEKAETIDDVNKRLEKLTSHIKARNIHPQVMKYCSREYLSEDYFHACFEAIKGLYDRIREMSHLNLDGNSLVDQAFSKDKPILIINNMTTVSEKNEFEGFKHLLLFLHKSVRNVEAHDIRLGNDEGLDWCLNIFTCISIAHQYLDRALPTCYLTVK